MRRKRRFERDDQCLSCIYVVNDVLCRRKQFMQNYDDCKYYTAKEEGKRRQESQCPTCIAKDRAICGRNPMRYKFCPDYAPKKEETKLSPTHYSRLKPEPIEVMKSWFPESMLANAIKYIARAGHKESETVEDDIKKAINYLYYYLFDRFPEFPE